MGLLPPFFELPEMLLGFATNKIGFSAASTTSGQLEAVTDEENIRYQTPLTGGLHELSLLSLGNCVL